MPDDPKSFKPAADESEELVKNETERTNKRLKIISILEPLGLLNCGLPGCSCSKFKPWFTRPGVCKTCNHNIADHV
jgi:hypothetical protein